MRLNLRVGIVIVLFIASIFLGCKSSMSLFDQSAYRQTVTIKVDALNIMDYATEEYSAHASEIMAIRTEMQKAYEYEKNRPKNTITTEMWKEMIDSNGHLLGGFLSFWKTQNDKNETLSIAHIRNQKESIGEAFDHIAQLESKKIKE